MIFKALLVAISAIVILPILNVVWRLSSNPHHHKHHPGACRQIKRKGTGSEDIQITSSGLAFITTGVTFPGCPPDFEAFAKSRGPGRIELFDMASSYDDSTEALQLKIKHGKDFNPATFRPHGMSLLEDKSKKGNHIIYVINHAENEVDRVEKFRYLPKTKELEHVASFFSELFHVTNDLDVVSEDKFYISNFVYFKHRALVPLEQLYSLPICNVLFHNGTGATSVIENVVSPNGVAVSKDKSFPNAEAVRVYERHSDLDLRQVQEVNLHSSLDNFHLSEDGNSLYGGCHPHARKVTMHLVNPENKAPSQVLRIPLKNGQIVEEEISIEFYDHGNLISASSSAGMYMNKMIIGSIMDSLVLCQLPTPL